MFEINIQTRCKKPDLNSIVKFQNYLRLQMISNGFSRDRSFGHKTKFDPHCKGQLDSE